MILFFVVSMYSILYLMCILYLKNSFISRVESGLISQSGYCYSWGPVSV